MDSLNENSYQCGQIRREGRKPANAEESATFEGTKEQFDVKGSPLRVKAYNGG